MYVHLHLTNCRMPTTLFSRVAAKSTRDLKRTIGGKPAGRPGCRLGV